ncbi:TIGR02679 family protein [Streptomyces sp. AcE210]|uniref:TIGR02679 family protein n=1 Tax=Streptomyces sp. AcE210 TaxID=2292703 RepID=UPI000E302DB5|nr:TIGR02679 family protein [Streptomyces sp. AcE210]RFC70987.1 TIGR02679 family protein [Streptomyces sp. AcE210]
MTATTPLELDRVRRLIGGPELDWLVQRVRRRMEREEPLTGTLTLAQPTDLQRRATERLLGRRPSARPTGATLAVRLDAVDAILRTSGASPDGLAAAVTALTGPVTPRRATREAEDLAWAHAHAPLDGLPAPLAAWAERLRTEGRLRRLARTPDAARTLAEQSAHALAALPADPPVSLPTFAARALGSAHALDDGTPTATLILSGVRALTGHSDGSGAAWRRAAWAAAGLLRDEVSSTVLTLGLRGNPALDWYADQGEPAILTLRQLAAPAVAIAAPALAYVCENPAVLTAAADARDPAAPPLICVQGQPSAAALALLRHLAGRGTRLRYHGDFDWGGLRIATALRTHVPWEPWRYTAADYRAAAPHATLPLSGTPADSPWDPELAVEIGRFGVRVEEEAVLDSLLDDVTVG